MCARVRFLLRFIGIRWIIHDSERRRWTIVDFILLSVITTSLYQSRILSARGRKRKEMLYRKTGYQSNREIVIYANAITGLRDYVLRKRDYLTSRICKYTVHRRYIVYRILDSVLLS